MNRRQAIAKDISMIMPKIARMMAQSFAKSYETMPPVQIFAILIIEKAEICHLYDLANELRVSPPTATGIVDRLQKQKLVMRIPDPDDRRAIIIKLTLSGRGLAREIKNGIYKRWEILLQKLSLTECETYLRIIKKLHASLEE